MKLSQKIRKIRKDKGLSLRQMQRRLQSIFGARALRYNTLYRIEVGLRDARTTSLSQICLGLGVSQKELLSGTGENKPAPVSCLKRRDKPAQYVYSEKAQAQFLTDEQKPFSVMRLFLQPGGKTKLERASGTRYEKYVYVLKGRITIAVDKERYLLRKDESACFPARLPHYFENNTVQKASCIIFRTRSSR